MIQEISNPKYLTSEKVDQLQNRKLIDSLFDLPVLFRRLEDAQRELFFNYENYVERGMEEATYNVTSFDQVDIGRMGVEALPNSDWYYEEIDEQGQKIVDILTRNFPTKFHSPYNYLITWDEGVLVFQVSLGEEEREQLASERGIEIKELNKMKKTFNPKKKSKKNVITLSGIIGWATDNVVNIHREDDHEEIDGFRPEDLGLEHIDWVKLKGHKIEYSINNNTDSVDNVLSVNLDSIKKSNPKYLTEKKLDEIETKKELGTERTFYDYLEKHGALTEDDIDQILSIVGHRCRVDTCKKLRARLQYHAHSIPSYSIIERLTKQHGKWSYTAGQSHTDEIATVKKIMLSEYKKSNPNYLKKRFDVLDRVKSLVDKGYEVYADDYRTHYKKSDLQKALLNPEAFITSSLFRYTDYGGGYTIAKANIRYIEENFKKLIDDGAISSYSTRHDGENMEFKFKALENDELYETLLSLYDYPLIDDQTLSEVESELEQECWDSYGREDFWKALIKKYGEEAEKLEQEQVDSLAFEAAQYTSCGMGEVENMQFNFYIKDLIDAISKLEEGKKLVKKQNPMPKCENPSWASDEDVWEKAKKQSLKSYGRISYPFVVYLYKQMGGKIKKKK